MIFTRSDLRAEHGGKSRGNAIRSAFNVNHVDLVNERCHVILVLEMSRLLLWWKRFFACLFYPDNSCICFQSGSNLRLSLNHHWLHFIYPYFIFIDDLIKFGSLFDFDEIIDHFFVLKCVPSINRQVYFCYGCCLLENVLHRLLLLLLFQGNWLAQIIDHHAVIC